jgi:type IV pilus assembly protein PilY1
MNNSIPSDITVLDMNGDSFADRMYFGDMGGRIWRLDIWHGQEPANLVSGGLLATLGAGHLASPTDADARRFYYAPDVSVVTPRGSPPYLNIAIGSGYRGHPLDEEIRDRFYAIRDYQPFNRRTNTSFNSPWVPIEDDDLVDVTANVEEPVVDGSNGWKINLVEDGTTWRGEKVLAESITVNGVIFFPTFTPTGVDPDNPCLAATLNRTWAVYLESARPFGLRDGENNTDDPSDRYLNDTQGGIAPGTAVIMDPHNDDDDDDDDEDDGPICLKGVATHKCVDVGDVTRTVWERRQ